MNSFRETAQGILDRLTAEQAAGVKKGNDFANELAAKDGFVAKVNEALYNFAQECAALGQLLAERYPTDWMGGTTSIPLDVLKNVQPQQATPAYGGMRVRCGGEKIRVSLRVPIKDDYSATAVIAPKWPLELGGPRQLRITAPCNRDPLVDITMVGESGERTTLRAWLEEKRDAIARDIMHFGVPRLVRTGSPEGPV